MNEIETFVNDSNSPHIIRYKGYLKYKKLSNIFIGIEIACVIAYLVITLLIIIDPNHTFTYLISYGISSILLIINTAVGRHFDDKMSKIYFEMFLDCYK